VDIEEIRETIYRYDAQLSAQGIPDSVSGGDRIKFRENLHGAIVVMAIMDGRAWADDDYAYLETHLRSYFGTAWGVASTTAIDPFPSIQGD